MSLIHNQSVVVITVLNEEENQKLKSGKIFFVSQASNRMWYILGYSDMIFDSDIS